MEIGGYPLYDWLTPTGWAILVPVGFALLVVGWIYSVHLIMKHGPKPVSHFIPKFTVMRRLARMLWGRITLKNWWLHWDARRRASRRRAQTAQLNRMTEQQLEMLRQGFINTGVSAEEANRAIEQMRSVWMQEVAAMEIICNNPLVSRDVVQGISDRFLGIHTLPTPLNCGIGDELNLVHIPVTQSMRVGAIVLLAPDGQIVAGTVARPVAAQPEPVREDPISTGLERIEDGTLRLRGEQIEVFEHDSGGWRPAPLPTRTLTHGLGGPGGTGGSGGIGGGGGRAPSRVLELPVRPQMQDVLVRWRHNSMEYRITFPSGEFTDISQAVIDTLGPEVRGRWMTRYRSYNHTNTAIFVEDYDLLRQYFPQAIGDDVRGERSVQPQTGTGGAALSQPKRRVDL
jgi:hypothetical protein